MRSPPDLKPATLKRNLCAIQKLHRLAGYDNVAADEAVLLAVRRASRNGPGRPDQALGVTAQRRDTLMAVVTDDLTGLRDKLLVMVGFDTLWRRAELVALHTEDFAFNANGTRSVLLRRAKNDPLGLGRTAHLSHASAKVLRTWIAARVSRAGLSCDRSMETRCHRGISRLTRYRGFSTSSARAGFDAAEIEKFSGAFAKGGSRPGAYERGFGILPITAAGGWKSMNVVARYIENVELNPREQATRLPPVEDTSG